MAGARPGEAESPPPSGHAARRISSAVHDFRQIKRRCVSCIPGPDREVRTLETAREPGRRGRHQGDEHDHRQHDRHVGCRAQEDRLDRDLIVVESGLHREGRDPERRRQEARLDRDHRDDAEMDQVEAEGLGDRCGDRHHDEQDRG